MFTVITPEEALEKTNEYNKARREKNIKWYEEVKLRYLSYLNKALGEGKRVFIKTDIYWGTERTSFDYDFQYAAIAIEVFTPFGWDVKYTPETWRDGWKITFSN